MPSADVTSSALVPLANSASVVSICRAFRLAESGGVERVPLAQDDPLTETSWHSWAEVDPLKSSVAERRARRCTGRASATSRN